MSVVKLCGYCFIDTVGIWNQYVQDFIEAYYDQAKDQLKIAILLKGAVDEANDVFDSFNISADKKDDLKEVLRLFQAHYAPKDSITYRRHLFFSRKQDSEESYEQYMAALGNLGIVSEFDKLFDGLVRDIFTCAVHDNSVNCKEWEMYLATKSWQRQEIKRRLSNKYSQNLR
uniref:Uncharacterized protein n=1 Tax=Lygus hesperus TaxID=30085 RepID=A0A146L0M7_LYGHE